MVVEPADALSLTFIVGMTLLQPRKYVFTVVTTLKRVEPPWHCVVLASVNDADENVWPLTPLMVARQSECCLQAW
jgi:hypothetical protein